MSMPISGTGTRSPVLSILIVNFNATHHLRQCLDSVAASTIAPLVETIVVDNASADFDAASLAAAYPWVEWLPQKHNTTYTGGNNLAFERATADLVLMLNPDTRVEADALERAVKHMLARPDLAALSAYLIGPDDQLQRYYRHLPRFADLPVMLFEPLFRRTRRGRQFLMLDEPFDRPTSVEDPPGAFILMRRSAIGDRLLDDGYFNFVSDLELCDRLGRAGEIVVFPDVRCHHQRAGAGVGTTDPAARLRLYHDFTWGLRRYFGTRIGPVRRIVFNALIALYWMARITRLSLRRPALTPRAVATAMAALSGRPPAY